MPGEVQDGGITFGQGGDACPVVVGQIVSFDHDTPSHRGAARARNTGKQRLDLCPQTRCAGGNDAQVIGFRFAPGRPDVHGRHPFSAGKDHDIPAFCRNGAQHLPVPNGHSFHTRVRQDPGFTHLQLQRLRLI
ncbi:hypothetical protein D3C72_1683760 [compost metagenome]